jgi:hypothetical protein
MPWHFGPSAVQLDAMFNHERSRRDIDVPAILSPRRAADWEALPTINAVLISDPNEAR